MNKLTQVMNMVNNVLYFKDQKGIAEIAFVDIESSKVTVKFAETEDKKTLTFTEFLDAVNILHELDIEFGGIPLYSQDVFRFTEVNKANVAFLRVESSDGENISIQLLDKDFNEFKNPSNKTFNSQEATAVLSQYADVLELIGNMNDEDFEEVIETLKGKSKESINFDFDVKVIKNKDGVMYYACNDKATESIDVISVVFVGAKLLDNDYKRLTLNYGDFEDLVNRGEFVESNPAELMKHSITKMDEAIKAEVADVVKDDVEEGICGVSCGCVDECELENDEDFDEDETDCDCFACREFRKYLNK